MKKIIKKIGKNFIMLSIVSAITISTCSLVTFAEGTVSEETAMTNLTNSVQGEMSEKTYKLEEGGTIKGSELLVKDDAYGYTIDEKNFKRLSSKGQKEAVSDIAEYSNQAVGVAEGVEEETVQLWWKELQSKQGVGSKFMTEILKNTKPDFVAANRVYAPLAEPIGVLMGIVSVALMSLLGLSMVSDIAYITLPPVRALAPEGEGKKNSYIFSHDAMYSVKEVEEGNGDGSKKQALGIYFKRKAFMLILLGICLLYLVQGELYTLVGYILDLVSGFLGF